MVTASLAAGGVWLPARSWKLTGRLPSWIAENAQGGFMRTFSSLCYSRYVPGPFLTKNQLVSRNVHVWVYFELVLLDYVREVANHVFACPRSASCWSVAKTRCRRFPTVTSLRRKPSSTCRISKWNVRSVGSCGRSCWRKRFARRIYTLAQRKRVSHN